jgi:hypothetical protein
MFSIKRAIIILLLICLALGTISYVVITVLKPSNQPVKTGSTQTAKVTPTPNAFSIDVPPVRSLQGSIRTMDGEIFFQNRIATVAGKITGPVVINQGTLLATGKNSMVSFDIATCTATLLESSEVSIVQTLPESIVFMQKSGTVRYATPADTFITVRAKTLLVEIHGETTISFDTEDPIIDVYPASGNAIVAYNNKQFESNRKILLPKGRIQFNYDTKKAVEE